MRGDDYLGSLLAKELDNSLHKRDNVIVYDGGTVPENFTGPIKKEAPSHIILIDAARMGKTPGHIRIIEKDEISHYNISTHAMPLSFLIKYLEHSTPAQIILVGIQPKEMETMYKVSDEIKESIEYLINLFKEIII